MHLLSYRPFLRQIFFLLSIVSFGAAHSQTPIADTAFLLIAVKNAKGLYTHSLGPASHLLNGIQYREYNPHPDDIGHPYFVSDDWVDGSVYYDGKLYEDVAILYDLVQEKLVIEHPYAGIKLQLISEKIKYFSVPGHTFVRLDADTIKNAAMDAGFYDLLYDGRTKFYVNRRKDKKEEIAGGGILVTFLENNRFYIYNKGLYTLVKTKSSVLEVLKDRKTEVRKYVRKNKIQYRKNREDAITRIVAFYDESGN